MVGADVPHRRLGTANQNQKQALHDFRLCLIRSEPATTNGSRRDHAPSGNKHLTRSGPHNRSGRSTVPHTDGSTSRACFAAKHMLLARAKLFRLIGHGYRETAIPATDFHRLNMDLRPPASVKIREDPWLFEGEVLRTSSNLVLPRKGGHFFVAQSAKKRRPLCEA
jgi:hypothetical protein